MAWLFLVALLGATYSYFLYPLALRALVAVRRAPNSSAPAAPQPEPAVSLIITAYNESARIRDKLDNSLALDCPGLEIVVASDCSSDDTDAVVRGYAGRGVRLVRAPERRGKEFAQLCAIEQSRGDVLVFSDTGTSMEPQAIRRMLAYFADPSIGAVSSEDRFVREDGTLVGEGAYVRYEMAVRRLESRLAGLVGLSGSLFAARRSVCAQWDIHSPSDFNTALNCARLGLKAVTAPDVLGTYRDIADPAREYPRKVRTVLRGMTGLFRHAEVLSPGRFGLFAWQVFSHKLMRWLVPPCLALLLLASVALAGEHPFYRMALGAQLVFYATALAAHRWPSLRESAPVRLVYFFCQVNLAIADAWGRYLRGRRMTTWQPSVR